MKSEKLPRRSPGAQVAAGKEREYYDEATDWDVSQKTRSMLSEKRAWLVASAATIGLMMSLGANFMLFPLKQIEHSIIRVDSVTGIVDVQRSLSNAKETYSEATDKYWLRLYVRERESFMYSRFDTQYRTVGLLSSAQEQKKWYEFFRPENPAAPVNQLGGKAGARAVIRSVSFLDKGVATVRLTKIIEQPNVAPIASYWIATIKFRYVNAPTSETDREVNPIGFQVAEYRIDPETDVTTAEGGK